MCLELTEHQERRRRATRLADLRTALCADGESYERSLRELLKEVG